MPNALIRNAHYTLQEISRWEQIGLADGTIVSGQQLAEQHVDILASRTAGYIFDAVQSYVRDYWEYGEAEKMALSEDEKYYVLRDTFGALCKRADISGQIRRDVKEWLFPDLAKAAPLEHVKLILPHKGSKCVVELPLISARRGSDKKNVGFPLHNGGRTTEFELCIHAGLFGFLQNKDLIKSGRARGKLNDGYQQIPLALNATIERGLTLIAMLTRAEYDSAWKAVRRGELAKYRKILLWLFDRWNTGSQNRASDMVIRWSELQSRGLVPAHKKRRLLRLQEIQKIAWLAECLRHDETAFPGCREVFVSNSGSEVVFRLQ